MIHAGSLDVGTCLSRLYDLVLKDDEIRSMVIGVYCKDII